MVDMGLSNASGQVSVALLADRSGADELAAHTLRHARTKDTLEADNVTLAVRRAVRRIGVFIRTLTQIHNTLCKTWHKGSVTRPRFSCRIHLV
jgi:hypothetical protein